MSKCAAFWHHTNIRSDNKVFPCCRFKTPIQEFTGDVVNILNSNEYKDLRDHSGPIAGCAKCDYEETMGVKSLRQKFNEEYDIKTVKLEFLEVGLDNICNLTCDGCWDEFSSSWAKKSESTIIVRSSTDITELPNTINKILFLGGEPLMTNRHRKLLKLIADPSVVNITYNTNGTFLLDNDTIDILKTFKNVDFILSIDGYAELNEKVRSGSKWSDILAFIDQIQKSDFNLTIHTVLHKNNWHGIGKIKEFVDSIGKPWTINILTYPKKLDISTIENKEDISNLFQSIDFPNKDQVLRHLYES
jgi:sulfatase maturation enzyme AslB (radical SAM superfamily)